VCCLPKKRYAKRIGILAFFIVTKSPEIAGLLYYTALSLRTDGGHGSCALSQMEVIEHVEMDCVCKKSNRDKSATYVYGKESVP